MFSVSGKVNNADVGTNTGVHGHPVEDRDTLNFAADAVTGVGVAIVNSAKMTGKTIGNTVAAVGSGVKNGVTAVKGLVDNTGRMVANLVEKTGELVYPPQLIDSEILKIEEYDHNCAAMRASSPIVRYPIAKDTFDKSECTNVHLQEKYFVQWVQNKKGTNLQKINHLLGHVVLDNQSKMIAYVLAKFPDNDQAVIDILEAMIMTLSFPNPDMPRVINIPIERTPKHSGKILVNGILTSAGDVLMRGIDEYGKHHGEQVTLVCIPSEGLFTDAANTWAEKCGSLTLASHVGLSAVKSHLHDYPAQKVLIQAFSRGSAVVDSFCQFIPESERHKIAIHTFGATQFATNTRGFLDARNYVSWKDPVTMPEYVVKHREHADEHKQLKVSLHEKQGAKLPIPVKIMYVETDGWIFLDHSFDAGYLEAREDSYKEFKRQTSFSTYPKELYRM